ncbi:MAG: diguanylate cyclase domain-containing protein [Gammaproteobacteria bacterium]
MTPPKAQADLESLSARLGELEDELAAKDARIAALETQEERLRFSLEGSGLGMWDWDVIKGEIRINARWAEMLGYTLEEIELNLETWEALIHPDDRVAVYADLNAHLSGATPYYENTHRLRTKSGEYRWVLDRGKVFERNADGQPSRAAGTHRDIHAEKEAQERLRQLALRDPLTGLANRRYLESVFGHALARARRARTGLGLVYIDLDGFKAVNDEQGHDAGDTVLTAVASRLEQAVRGEDIVARIGGDEFCVLVNEATDDRQLVGLARRALAMVREPIALDGAQVTLSCSIGIARFPENGGTLAALLKASDAAMYRVKRHGKNDVSVAA